MSDYRLTNEKMKTFVNNDKIGMFQTAEKLTEFGEKQDEANEALAYNVNDLIKRVCALEEEQYLTKSLEKSILPLWTLYHP